MVILISHKSLFTRYKPYNAIRQIVGFSFKIFCFSEVFVKNLICMTL